MSTGQDRVPVTSFIASLTGSLARSTTSRRQHDEGNSSEADILCPADEGDPLSLSPIRLPSDAKAPRPGIPSHSNRDAAAPAPCKRGATIPTSRERHDLQRTRKPPAWAAGGAPEERFVRHARSLVRAGHRLIQRQQQSSSTSEKSPVVAGVRRTSSAGAGAGAVFNAGAADTGGMVGRRNSAASMGTSTTTPLRLKSDSAVGFVLSPSRPVPRNLGKATSTHDLRSLSAARGSSETATLAGTGSYLESGDVGTTADELVVDLEAATPNWAAMPSTPYRSHDDGGDGGVTPNTKTTIRRRALMSPNLRQEHPPERPPGRDGGTQTTTTGDMVETEETVREGTHLLVAPQVSCFNTTHTPERDPADGGIHRVEDGMRRPAFTAAAPLTASSSNDPHADVVIHALTASSHVLQTQVEELTERCAALTEALAVQRTTTVQRASVATLTLVADESVLRGHLQEEFLAVMTALHVGVCQWAREAVAACEARWLERCATECAVLEHRLTNDHHVSTARQLQQMEAAMADVADHHARQLERITALHWAAVETAPSANVTAATVAVPPAETLFTPPEVASDPQTSRDGSCVAGNSTTIAAISAGVMTGPATVTADASTLTPQRLLLTAIQSTQTAAVPFNAVLPVPPTTASSHSGSLFATSTALQACQNESVGPSTAKTTRRASLTGAGPAPAPVSVPVPVRSTSAAASEFEDETFTVVFQRPEKYDDAKRGHIEEEGDGGVVVGVVSTEGRGAATTHSLAKRTLSVLASLSDSFASSLSAQSDLWCAAIRGLKPAAATSPPAPPGISSTSTGSRGGVMDAVQPPLYLACPHKPAGSSDDAAVLSKISATSATQTIELEDVASQEAKRVQLQREMEKAEQEETIRSLRARHTAEVATLREQAAAESVLRDAERAELRRAMERLTVLQSSHTALHRTLTAETVVHAAVRQQLDVLAEAIMGDEEEDEEEETAGTADVRRTSSQTPLQKHQRQKRSVFSSCDASTLPPADAGADGDGVLSETVAELRGLSDESFVSWLRHRDALQEALLADAAHAACDRVLLREVQAVSIIGRPSPSTIHGQGTDPTTTSADCADNGSDGSDVLGGLARELWSNFTTVDAALLVVRLRTLVAFVLRAATGLEGILADVTALRLQGAAHPHPHATGTASHHTTTAIHAAVERVGKQLQYVLMTHLRPVLDPAAATGTHHANPQCSDDVLHAHDNASFSKGSRGGMRSSSNRYPAAEPPIVAVPPSISATTTTAAFASSPTAGLFSDEPATPIITAPVPVNLRFTPSAGDAVDRVRMAAPRSGNTTPTTQRQQTRSRTSSAHGMPSHVGAEVRPHHPQHPPPPSTDASSNLQAARGSRYGPEPSQATPRETPRTAAAASRSRGGGMHQQQDMPPACTSHNPRYCRDSGHRCRSPPAQARPFSPTQLWAHTSGLEEHRRKKEASARLEGLAASRDDENHRNSSQYKDVGSGVDDRHLNNSSHWMGIHTSPPSTRGGVPERAYRREAPFPSSRPASTAAASAPRWGSSFGQNMGSGGFNSSASGGGELPLRSPLARALHGHMLDLAHQHHHHNSHSNHNHHGGGGGFRSPPEY